MRNANEIYGEMQKAKREVRALNKQIRGLKKEHLQTVNAMNYQAYLKTKHWNDTRKKALKRAKCTCQLCGTKDSVLNVHHKTYENKGKEKAKDLIVLCSNCHAKFHDKLQD